MNDEGDQDGYLRWCEERDDYYLRKLEDECPRCGGEGKVPTADYECYLGAMYKPCPECHGDLCEDQPPLT